VAGDCNSLAETHAWFDFRVAHHFPNILIFVLPAHPRARRIDVSLGGPFNIQRGLCFSSTASAAAYELPQVENLSKIV